MCLWVVCVYLCSCQALWPITRSPAFRWFTIVEIPFLTYTTLLFQRPDPSSTTELHQLLISLLQRKKKGGGTKILNCIFIVYHRKSFIVRSVRSRSPSSTRELMHGLSGDESHIKYQLLQLTEPSNRKVLDHPMPNTTSIGQRPLSYSSFIFELTREGFPPNLLNFVA